MSLSANDKIADVITRHPHLLRMMARFRLPLGVGEKTVQEVCAQQGVHAPTFLAVANYLVDGIASASASIPHISVEAMMEYLTSSHRYFLQFQLPTIRRQLLLALDCSDGNQVAYLILKYYDQYTADVRRHMSFEDQKIFPYVRNLLQGVRTPAFGIQRYAKAHQGIDQKLQELKNIIIRYYPATEANEPLSKVLIDIFQCETDLRSHCEMEDYLFIPAVTRLEASGVDSMHAAGQDNSATQELTEREREIIQHIVSGMSTKQIAERLFLSPTTVATHRKNIARKLGIHTTAGLTIYALTTGITSLSEIKPEALG